MSDHRQSIWPEMLITRKRPHRAKASRTTSGPHSRKPGRPMKRAATLKSSRNLTRQLQQVYVQDMAIREQNLSTTDLSILERLPVELIEQIFFYALEVNLAKSSTFLSSILSTPPIHHALILFAFFDDDQSGPVEKHFFRPAEYRCISWEDKLRIQSGIWTCEWCTLELIKSCMPELSRLKMIQVWKTESEREHLLLGQFNVEMSEPQVPNESIKLIAPLPRFDDQTGMEEHFLARWDLNTGKEVDLYARPNDVVGEQGFLPRIRTWTSMADSKAQLYKTLGEAVSILATRVIPDWLLESKEWTQPRVELLKLLRQGLRFIQNPNILLISAEALFKGMQYAISERRTDVLRILLELHYGTMSLPRELVDQYEEENSQSFRRFARATAHPLPIDLFHLACEQEEKSSELLSLLIREGIDSIKDDRALTAWAVRAKADGDPLGVWLLEHMVGTNDYGLQLNEPLFTGGYFSWRAEGSFPFPQQTFVEEIGYIYEGASGEIPHNPDGGPCG